MRFSDIFLFYEQYWSTLFFTELHKIAQKKNEKKHRIHPNFLWCLRPIIYFQNQSTDRGSAVIFIAKIQMVFFFPVLKHMRVGTSDVKWNGRKCSMGGFIHGAPQAKKKCNIWGTNTNCEHWFDDKSIDKVIGFRVSVDLQRTPGFLVFPKTTPGFLGKPGVEPRE